MLSKSAIKLLYWLNKRDEWLYWEQIRNQCPIFTDRAFKGLVSGEFVQKMICGDPYEMPDKDPAENESIPYQYRINDKGVAYLEYDREQRIDKWITRGLAILAIVISLLSLR